MMIRLSCAALAVACIMSTSVFGDEQRGIELTPGLSTADLRSEINRYRSPLLKARTQRSLGAAVSLELDERQLNELKNRRTLVLTDFVLAPMARAGEPSIVDLELKRLRVTSEDTQFVIGTADGDVPMPRPDVTMFTGRVAGERDSSVFLSFSPHGTHGYVRSRGITQIISAGEHGSDDELLIYNVDALPPGTIHWRDHVCQAHTAGIAPPNPMVLDVDLGSPPCRTVKFAVETDREYTLELFDDDLDAAAAYVETLMGASSGLYTDAINLRYEITYVRLWEDEDPWTQGGASSQLNQFRNYWNANMSHIDRHLGHFLSGRDLGGGVAWLGAVCDDIWGYGLSGNLNGFFPYPLQNNSPQNWDIMVVTHEIGHNLGTPHTHDFCPPLDQCAPANYFGQCQDEQQCIPNGTIMSYCHQCEGGMVNIVLEFHPAVMQTMLAHLQGIDDCNLNCPPGGGGEAYYEIILAEGEENEQGQVVGLLQPPFTNAAGAVAFTGGFLDGDRFVWANEDFAWQNSFEQGYTLTGSTSTMGIADDGQWFYNPTIDGQDGLWSSTGYIISATDPAPVAGGMFITFTSRLQMLPDGNRYVVAGLSDILGGTTQQRVLYRIDPLGVFHKVVQDGDTVADGRLLRLNGGVGYGYRISDNGLHRIHRMQEAGESPYNFVYVDGEVVADEGEAAIGQDGPVWNTFGSVAINNAGDSLFSATIVEKDADPVHVIAYNGEVALRAGDEVANFTIPHGATLRDLSMNNLGQAVHVWNWNTDNGPLRGLFRGEAADLAGSELILLVGDQLDTDGDDEPDHILKQIHAINIAGATIDLSDHPFFYLRVELADMAEQDEFQAIMRVGVADQQPPTCLGDLNDDHVVDVSDLLILLSGWGTCGDPCVADLNEDQVVDVSDLLILLSAWGPCA